MHKGASIKLSAQNMQFCFINISAEILLHILAYNFCTKRHTLIYCQMLLQLKASKIICTGASNQIIFDEFKWQQHLTIHQSMVLWAKVVAKNVGEIDHCSLLF